MTVLGTVGQRPSPPLVSLYFASVGSSLIGIVLATFPLCMVLLGSSFLFRKKKATQKRCSKLQWPG